MSDEKIIPISQVPKDFDDLSVGTVTSPLHRPFKGKFNGRVVIIPGMKEIKSSNGKVVWRKNPSKPIPLRIAMLVANQIAQRIVRKEHRDKIEAETDEKKREKFETEAIPNYKKRCWEIQKAMVKEQHSEEELS